MLRYCLVARCFCYSRYGWRQIAQTTSELSSDDRYIRSRNKGGAFDPSGDVTKTRHRSTRRARAPSFTENGDIAVKSNTINSSKLDRSRRFVNSSGRASSKSPTRSDESVGGNRFHRFATEGLSDESQPLRYQSEMDVDSSDRFGDSVPDAFAKVGVSRAELQVLDDESESESEGDKSPGAQLRKVHVDKLSKVNRNTCFWYEQRIKDCVKNGLVGDALRILEEDMLVKDRILPTAYGFNMCISACAEIGYVSKAFALFDTMCRLDLQPTPHTLTSLFHCCANAMSISDEFARADRRGLRRLVSFASHFSNVKQGVDGSKTDRLNGSNIKPLRLKLTVSDKNPSIRNVAHEKEADQRNDKSMDQTATTTFKSDNMVDKRGAIDSAFEYASELYATITKPGSRFAPLVNRYVLNAAMSCYSERGAYEDCLKIFDKMCEARIWPDSYTTSTLLRCCRKRPETGFRDAIDTWNRLRNTYKRLRINSRNYLELLECAARCGVGELADNATTKVFSQPVFSRRRNAALLELSDQKKAAFLRLRKALSDNSRHPVPAGGNNLELSEAYEQYNSLQDFNESLTKEQPNKSVMQTLTDADRFSSFRLLKEPARVSVSIENQALVLSLTSTDSHDRLDDVKSGTTDMDWYMKSPFSLIDSDFCAADGNKSTFSVSLRVLNSSASARFALLGGLDTFLRSLRADGTDAIPMQILTKLCDVLPSTKEADNALIAEMQKHRSKLQQVDVPFVNAIIRRARQRRDEATASQSLALLTDSGLQVTVVTFASLAINCTRRTDAERLLADMRLANLRPNVVVLNTLLDASAYDFQYKRFLLEYATRVALCPNRETVIIIESHIERARSKMRSIEKTRRAVSASRSEAASEVSLDPNDSYFMSKYFLEGYSAFSTYYHQWLRKTTVDDREERHREAPFAAYKTEADDKPIQIVQPEDRT